MNVFKTKKGIFIEKNSVGFYLKNDNWDTLINRENLFQYLENQYLNLQAKEQAVDINAIEIVAPIGTQEVWAAGVTYLRSKAARMDESKDSGGAIFYDKVYEAERPELFFKAMPHKVVGNNASVRIRKDSTWNVPEPELTLVINAAGTIVGYTIGNDMSSRSIEGENPLYLPQAKVYDGSAAIGPCIAVFEKPIKFDAFIKMSIKRAGQIAFEGETTIDKMKRSHEELVNFLFRDATYPTGVYLMTGTCVVPDNDFTLQIGDTVRIEIEEIGVLENSVL